MGINGNINNIFITKLIMYQDPNEEYPDFIENF